MMMESDMSIVGIRLLRCRVVLSKEKMREDKEIKVQELFVYNEIY